MAWRKDAACLGMDTELFYHGEYTPEGVEAKKTCQSCPVAKECLDFDLAFDDQWGIWAGLNEKDRRAIKKRRKTVGRTALRSAS